LSSVIPDSSSGRGLLVHGGLRPQTHGRRGPQLLEKTRGKEWLMKKSLFALFSVIVFVGFLPVLAISGNSSMREHIIKTTKTDKIQNVFCRFDRLTDILTPGRVKKVLMSDSSDFKITIIHEKKMTHIVIKPLKKDATSDVFIFGRNSVLYLTVKTVYGKQHYLNHVEIGEGK